MPPTQLDPDVLNLTKAIRQVESGGNFGARGASGEFGAYQFTEPTWQAYSKEVLGQAVPLMQATREQQNQVAYTKVKQWKDAGRNIGEVASMWNAGEGRPDAYLGWKGTNSLGVSFDTGDYAAKVAQTYQGFKTGGAPQPTETAMAPVAPARPTYGATFPSQQGESPVVAGLKAIGNLPSSAYHLGEGIFDAVSHPIRTVKGIGQTVIGGAEKLFGDSDPNDEASQTFGAVAQAFKDRYGSLEALQNTATNDPFGFGLDVASIVAGGAGALGRTAEVADAASAAAKLAMKPVAAPVKGIGRAGAAVTGYGVSKVTGLEPSTIGSILRNPEAFTGDSIAAGAAGRAELAEEVGSALRARIDDLGDTGKGYTPIRDLSPDTTVSADLTKTVPLGGGKTMEYALVDAPDGLLTLPELRKKVELLEADKSVNPGAVKNSRRALDAREAVDSIPFEVRVPKTWLTSKLSEVMGVKVGKDGKMTSSASGKVRESKDLRALENLYSTYNGAFQKGYLTTNEYLNFRADLAKLAKFDREVSKSSVLENLSGIVRGQFNTEFRSQIPGLEKLDNEFSIKKSELDRLRKGIIDKDGNLNFSAINKIANAAGKGKDLFLAQLEDIIPGIGKRIEVQKAIEDINLASGNKVGTYTKNGLEVGGVVAGLTTGNIPLVAGAIASAIFATPEVAVSLLRAYGMNKQLVNQVVNRLNLQSKVMNLPAAGAANAAIARPAEAAAPIVAPVALETLVQEDATEEEVTV